MKTTVNRQVALLIIRLTLGFIVLMQGFGKVFSMGVENMYASYMQPTFAEKLPNFLIYATAYYTSYVELIAGLLLVLGLKRDYALYFIGSVLIIVSFGHGLEQPIWDLSHVLFRLLPLSVLLLLPSEWDRYRLDTLIKPRK